MKLHIIHGWAYSIEPWQKTVDILKARGVEVVQLKVPGLTESSDKVWTVDDYVGWLSGKLKDEKQPIVLGHSNGGRIAMHFDVRFPGLLKHLILLNSAGIEAGSNQLSLKRRLFKVASKVLSPLKSLPLARKIVHRLLKSDYFDAPPNMKKTLTNMLSSDAAFDASKVSAQTSILWGEDDSVTPLSLGKKLHQLISGSTLAIVPEWQHSPYRTHPEQLAEEILKMLETAK